MFRATTADFYKGMFIEYKGEPHQIVEFQHVNPGKGSAFVRTKLKNVKTGRAQEFTYKSGESIEELPVQVREMQYLYPDISGFHFMDNHTYEQTQVAKSVLEQYAQFMKEGEVYQILMLEDVAVGVRFPKKVKLAITETTDRAARGNTASGNATKEAIVETGLSVQVPLFIKNGDTIAIDPETGSYVERVS